jgi:hypothetical protein
MGMTALEPVGRTEVNTISEDRVESFDDLAAEINQEHRAVCEAMNAGWSTHGGRVSC